MTDFLDEKRREITDRLKELKPYVDEYGRLEAAASALDGVGGSTSTRTATATAPRRRKKGPGRPRGSRTAAKAKATPTAVKAPAKPGRPAKRRAGRRKGSGTRAAEALSFVKGQPGITIPELAAKMGIKQNYLYRVLPGLESEGKVNKQGRGWHPKG
ncbi:MAG TPA: hypothetical protein VES97_12845 [Solirubrobacteraceae bacterium]|nr:hypothetical protein [Solirubrobacteraceae bacterium]